MQVRNLRLQQRVSLNFLGRDTLSQEFKRTNFAADEPVAPRTRPLLQSQKNRKR